MARRHNLLVRLLAIAVLIAACSIAATAWLAAQTTTGTIEREQGKALATDARIYDRLLEYAATHASWSGVQSTVDVLAKQTGRRITLTTQSRQPLADSATGKAPELPVNHTVVVNPLAVDAVLKPGLKTLMDPRAIGPYRLADRERQQLTARMDRYVRCMEQNTGVRPTVVVLQNGRPTVEDVDRRRLRLDKACGPAYPSDLTKGELAANKQLIGLLNACLHRQPAVVEDLTPELYSGPEAIASYAAYSPTVAKCADTARREQLTPYVAPPALLFLTAPGGKQPPVVGLSAAGTKRIALAALAVLIVTVVVTWLAAARLVRPIRALTAAAQRMGSGDRAVRVDSHAKGELGQLAAAFNAMSQHLEKTEDQRKSMVSDIAHELRTPLGNIRGWLEATQDGVAAVEPELIASLLEEAVLLQYLVDDLQDLAQADAGTLRLHPEPIDVAELVDQVAAAHLTRAEECGVRLRAATRGQLVMTADPARLRQALGNLVANAVRYTPSGGEVTVIARRDGAGVVLEVTDTGVGISPEDLPHVFDRFWRADKSRSRRTGGSGLGLAITRHLTEAHGGTASASSEPGRGSSFRLVLPAEAGAVAEEPTGSGDAPTSTRR